MDDLARINTNIAALRAALTLNRINDEILLQEPISFSSIEELRIPSCEVWSAALCQRPHVFQEVLLLGEQRSLVQFLYRYLRETISSLPQLFEIPHNVFADSRPPEVAFSIVGIAFHSFVELRDRLNKALRK